jgi:SAM-dependent methyltransferase
VRRLVPRFRAIAQIHHRSFEFVARTLKLDSATTRQLLPPPHLHNVGLGNFETVGNNYLVLLVQVGGLQPDDRVLDVGSGTGRIARPLTTYLVSGTYDGLEIVKPSVRWCQHAYRRHVNFHFHHADVRNSVYNPSGQYASRDYRFPFGDGSFSFAVLTSVFTHMLPAEVERYLSEIRRVLAPGGRVFATFFLLDDAARACLARGEAAITFDYEAPGCRLHIAEAPEAAVAYDLQDMLEMCRRAGLAVSRVCPGVWSGRKNGSDWQDIVLLEH